jgi:hypothetical protein
MSTVKIKQHDTKGVFVDTLTVDDAPINLTGCTIYFLLRRPGFAIKQAGTVTNPNTGEVSYQPVATDVSETGKFKQEWEIVFPDTKVLTSPNNDYNTVIIEPDLG